MKNRNEVIRAMKCCIKDEDLPCEGNCPYSGEEGCVDKVMADALAQLVEYVRMAEHNQEVAEATLAQQAENLKDWVPVHPDLHKAVKKLGDQYERSKNSPYVKKPVAHALFHTWRWADERRNGDVQ